MCKVNVNSLKQLFDFFLKESNISFPKWKRNKASAWNGWKHQDKLNKVREVKIKAYVMAKETQKQKYNTESVLTGQCGTDCA